jgi:hypothetical protein
MQTDVFQELSAEIMLSVTFADAASAAEGARALQLRLAQLDATRVVVVEPEEGVRITGVEAAAAFGVAIIVARGARELLVELRLVVQELKKFARELGVGDLAATVDGQALEEVTEEHLAKHAKKAGKRA